MKKFFLLFAALMVVLIVVLLFRTIMVSSEKNSIFSKSSAPLLAEELQVSHNLSRAIQFQTISHHDSSKFNFQAFRNFHIFLAEIFPNLHSNLEKEVVGDYSLLYHWRGQDSALKPILFLAHQDVVPVLPGSKTNWQYPPFDGRNDGTYIWGRGALDDKASLLGILEAAEILLQEGFQPRRSIYFAFGHDEEIGGKNGAGNIAKKLETHGLKFELILDEGAAIVEGMVPGIELPVALIGVAEKGYVSLELTTKVTGGHSSMPPRNTAVGIISKAITQLEEKPFPANMKYVNRFLEGIAAQAPFAQRIIFANLWRFNPLVENIFSKNPSTDALLRTTTATTMFNGSDKDNVLPDKASAVINFRILPGETVESVIDYVKSAVDDPRITITPINVFNNPSPVSRTDSKSYKFLEKTIGELSSKEEIIIAPFLVLAGTDAKHYSNLSDNIFRFLFIKMQPEDIQRVHGINERISIENYHNSIRFYYQLIRNSDEL